MYCDICFKINCARGINCVCGKFLHNSCLLLQQGTKCAFCRRDVSYRINALRAKIRARALAKRIKRIKRSKKQLRKARELAANWTVESAPIIEYCSIHSRHDCECSDTVTQKVDKSRIYEDMSQFVPVF